MVRLDMSFLGGFQVLLNQQPVTRFRSANNRGLLVYLALERERPIARERLTTLFWPDGSTTNGRNNLRQSLFQLRKLLGDSSGDEPPYLLVTRQTVRFNPDSALRLDVHQFSRAIDERDLETAVSHYAGDLLPGFTCDSVEFEDWLRQEREQLHNLAIGAMAELARGYLHGGRFEAAQQMAEGQLRLEPWHEQAHRQLMKAFVLAGHRARALRQFELCRSVLMEELRIEPAAETVALFEDIKTGRLGSAVSDEPIRPPVRVKHNLPTFSDGLLGRALEVGQISHRLTEEKRRLVSIVGPGGVGKTRLAIGVGATMLTHFRDGVYLVDLAPLNRGDEIPTAIAETLNYQVPDKGQPLVPQLLTFLKTKEQLLILDNFEHLIDGALLINGILQSCPHLAVLVTSRQRLGLTGEDRFELSGLDFPDLVSSEDAQTFSAVQLFVEFGRRVQISFTLTGSNVADVVRICQLVQGMPLGLVLAASWLELLTPAEIAHAVEGSLDFLAAELADLPSRQRSMRAVFDYSWQLLTPAEQALLAKASVFRGSFTREAAEQIAGANLRLLLGLVAKSFVQRDWETGRLSIHELLRQFAAKKRPQFETGDTRSAHCTYYAGKILAETRGTLGLHAVHIPGTYAADRENLLRAWEWALEHGMVDLLANLAPAIGMFSAKQGRQATSVLAEAIAVARESAATRSSHALFQLLLLAQTIRSGFDESRLVQKGLLALLPTLEEEPYPDLLFWLHVWLAYLEPTPDNIWYRKAYETAAAMQDEWLVNVLAVFKAMFGMEADALNEGLLARLHELLAYFDAERRSGGYSSRFISYLLLASLQKVYTALGAFEQATRYSRRCLTIAKAWQELMWIGNGFADLAGTYWAMGAPEKARAAYAESFEWHLAIGQTWETLGFVVGLAKRFPEFVGGAEAAVSILSMITRHPEVAAYHVQEIHDALPQFRADIGDDAVTRAWNEGKRLGFDAVVQIIRRSAP